MKIIRPYSRLMPLPALPGCKEFDHSMGIRLLQHIELCARISHRSEDAVTPISWERIIPSVVIEHGDWSVVEHATVSVDTYVDRGITHEWVRHRLFGFTQESTRFVNYEKKMPPAFIYPQPDIECGYCLSGNQVVNFNYKDWWHELSDPNVENHCKYDPDWLTSIFIAERGYKSLLAKKWRPQEARSLFPNALASRIITTGNLRMWRHFLIMRTCAEAHPQMKQVTIPLLKEFQTKIPLLFDDIMAGEKQSLAMKKAR